MSQTERRSVIKEVRRGLAKTLFEKLLPPIELEKIPDASLMQAKIEDSQHANYEKSANLYYSVLQTSENTEERLNAMLGLVQQLINLGRYGQAKQLLSPVYMDYVSSVFDLEPRLGVYHQARILEKLGWIADNELDYHKAGEYFSEVNRKMELTDAHDRTPEEKALHSTAVHFLGRAYFGMGEYFQAEQYFQIHLENPDLNDDEKGFSNGWIARCCMELGDLSSAELYASRADYFFTKYVTEKQGRYDLFAHVHLLRGSIKAREGKFVTARKSFEDAIGIYSRKEKETGKGYPKGKARAFYGIAGTYAAQRNYPFALVYFIKGLKTFPLSMAKSIE